MYKVDGSSLDLGETMGEFLFLIDDDMFFQNIETKEIYIIDIDKEEIRVPKRMNEELTLYIRIAENLTIQKLTNNSIVMYDSKGNMIQTVFR